MTYIHYVFGRVNESHVVLSNDHDLENSNEPHCRMVHHLIDRPRIGNVILVGLHIAHL